MAANDPRDWMWAEAVQMLARAEHLHKQLFQPGTPNARQPCWEPPVDMIETDHEVLILAALPGVDPDQVQAVIENGVLVIRGARVLPAELRTAIIHRLELPQGRFERRVPLPAGRYDHVQRSGGNGCLIITLRKSPAAGGRP